MTNRIQIVGCIFHTRAHRVHGDSGWSLREKCTYRGIFEQLSYHSEQASWWLLLPLSHPVLVLRLWLYVPWKRPVGVWIWTSLGWVSSFFACICQGEQGGETTARTSQILDQPRLLFRRVTCTWMWFRSNSCLTFKPQDNLSHTSFLCCKMWNLFVLLEYLLDVHLLPLQ